MPEQKVTRAIILDAALAVVRADGEDALTARSVATEAACSVQPIYSLFGDMAHLADELYDHARIWVHDYNLRYADVGGNLFESNGLSHLRLAATETHLFRFLYLSSHMSPHGIEGMFRNVALDGVEACIQELGQLSAAVAHELYLNMIVYVHGLAAMVACGARFGDEELAARIDAAFHAFLEGR